MISINSVELNAWVMAFFFPMTRIMAFMASAPPFNNVIVRPRVRLMIGLAITYAIVPVIPPLPAINPTGTAILLILVEQMLIGFAMGFSLRLIFSAIDLAGNVFSMQIGLGFAMSYAPSSAAQTLVLSEFIGVLALLTFLALNGHLISISVLAQSFTVIPIGVFPGELSWLNVAKMGTVIYASALMIALPIVCAMAITNIAIGVLSRVSPQLNLMAIGFPITLMLGFCVLYVALLYLGPLLHKLFDVGLTAMLGNFVIR